MTGFMYLCLPYLPAKISTSLVPYMGRNYEYFSNYQILLTGLHYLQSLALGMSDHGEYKIIRSGKLAYLESSSP